MLLSTKSRYVEVRDGRDDEDFYRGQGMFLIRLHVMGLKGMSLYKPPSPSEHYIHLHLQCCLKRIGRADRIPTPVPVRSSA